MVRADLGVIPGARLTPGFEVRCERAEGWIGLRQRCQNARCFAVLTQRQVATIAARIGDELVGFVERLGDIQRFLSTQAKLLRADFLQGAQIERQRRRFAHAFGPESLQPSAARRAHGLGRSLR